ATVMKSVQEFILRNTSAVHDIGIDGEIEVLKGFCTGVEALLSEEGPLTDLSLADMNNEVKTQITSKKMTEAREKKLESADEQCEFITDILSSIKHGARDLLT